MITLSNKAPRGSFKISTKGGAKRKNKRGIRAISEPIDIANK